MRLTKFWIVTYPKPESELGDICFECEDFYQLERQFKGGLEGCDILGFYDNESDAKQDAKSLLSTHVER